MPQDLAKRMRSRVKEIRLGLSLTQVQFATKAGLQHKHYQTILAGQRRLNATTAGHIRSDHLG